jgi:WD40 repeat protein
VTFSADGKRLAGGAWDPSAKLSPALRARTDPKRLVWDKTVRVWDLDKGPEPLLLTGHSGGVNAVIFSPDGKRLASAAEDNTIRLWNVDKGTELLVLKGVGLGDMQKPVQVMAFSPDGDRLTSATVHRNTSGPIRGGDYAVRLWDVHKGPEPVLLNGHTGGVAALAFSPDGKRVASASADNTVRLWDVDKGKELLVLKGHTGTVAAVVFTSDGKRLVSASADATIRLWDVGTGVETLQLKGHTDHISAILFNRDGSRLASASADGTVRIWEAPKAPANSEPK